MERRRCLTAVFPRPYNTRKGTLALLRVLHHVFLGSYIMRTLTLGTALVGLLALAGVIVAQEGPELVVTTDNDLLRTVSTNEAALDSQLAARSVEIRGIAKRIIRTETGDYVLQFAPDSLSDNFVRLHVNCEFGKDQRDALGNLQLPAAVTIRGAVKASLWEPRYDNHKYYKVVIRDAQVTAVNSLLR